MMDGLVVHLSNMLELYAALCDGMSHFHVTPCGLSKVPGYWSVEVVVGPASAALQTLGSRTVKRDRHFGGAVRHAEINEEPPSASKLRKIVFFDI